MPNVQCPQCSAWNPADLPWCRGCGGSLRSQPGDVPAPSTASTSPERTGGEARPAPLTERERELWKRKTARREEWADVDRRAKRQDRALERASRRKEREKELDAIVTSLAEGERTLQNSAEEDWDVGVDAPDGAQVVVAPEFAASPGGPGGDGTGRVRTHVAGLDEALGGGIPRGFVVIVEGAPGTMKSSLAFWILAHQDPGDRHGGLYVTCEESGGSLLRQMGALGVDLDAAASRVKILDAPMLSRLLAKPKADWLDVLRATIESLRSERPFDILVLDSLDALAVKARFVDRRRELFRLFEWFRDLGLTTLVIAERPDYVVRGNVLQGRYDENFLADGVINLRLHLISDLDVQRRVRIVKMRATEHETGYLALHAAEGEFAVARVLRG